MTEEIPIEKLYSQPIVQELLDKVEKHKDIENIKIPYVIKDKILMSPGVWNNYYYSAESIKDAFLKTRWDNKEIRSLFLDHADKSSREWIGEVKNPRLRGEDVVGDLVFVEKPTAQKLAYGAKMGISPKVHGQEDENKMVSFLFDNFSVVINPAVKTAYINNMEVAKMADDKDKPKVEPKPEAPKEEPKAEAPKEEAPAPAEPAAEPAPAEETNVEKAEDLVYAMSEIGGMAEIAKKAKEIRNKEELWSDAIKRAAKVLEDEKPAEPAPEKPAEPAPEKPAAEMAEADVVSQIIKLAELLKNKAAAVPVVKNEEKPAEPAPTPAPEAPKDTAKMTEMSTKIKTLSEEVVTLTKKLNEPDKISQKVETLSESDAVKMIEKDPDGAFLNVLNRMGPGGN